MTDPTQDPRYLQDPYPTYAAMRSACPVQAVAGGSGGRLSYLVTGYAEAREALADARLSKDTAAFFAGKESKGRLHPAVAHNMLSSDPPEHTRLRKLVTKAFTTGAVAELRPFIARVTDDLLDQWPVGEPFDFVTGLAVPLPVIVICELLGVPDEDRPDIQRWSGELFAAGQPEVIDAASHSLADYMTDLIAAKRRHPAKSLLDRLISARDGHDRLSEEELVSLAVLLLVAGHETTTSFLGNATLSLLQHPAELDRLRQNPDDIPTVLDERFDSTPRQHGHLPVHHGGHHARRHRHPDRRTGPGRPRSRQPRPGTVPVTGPARCEPGRCRPPRLRARYPPLRRRSPGQGRGRNRAARGTDTVPGPPARRTARPASVAARPSCTRSGLASRPEIGRFFWIAPAGAGCQCGV